MPKTLQAEPVDPSRAHERSGPAYHRDETRHERALKLHGKKPNVADADAKAATVWKWVIGLTVLALGGMGYYGGRELVAVAEREAHVEKFWPLNGVVAGDPRRPILAYLDPEGKLGFAYIHGYDAATVDGVRRIYYTGEKEITDHAAAIRELTKYGLDSGKLANLREAELPLGKQSSDDVKRFRVFSLLRQLMVQYEALPKTEPPETPKPVGVLWDGPVHNVILAAISHRARINAV